MKLTEILYEDVKEIWDGYLKHPFVSGIGDGSLSLERFRFYMLQDYLYLYDYARVYALGIVKSREPEMMQFFSQLVNDTLNGEMDIHRGYMARLGITPEEVANVKPSIPTICWKSDTMKAFWNCLFPFSPAHGAIR